MKAILIMALMLVLTLTAACHDLAEPAAGLDSDAAPDASDCSEREDTDTDTDTEVDAGDTDTDTDCSEHQNAHDDACGLLGLYLQEDSIWGDASKASAWEYCENYCPEFMAQFE